MSEETEPIEQRLRQGMAKRLKLDNLPGWVHGVGLGGTLAVFAVLLVLFLLLKDVAVWTGWEPARELVDPSYAERIYPDSVFRTRMNTWSNLCYILLGFYAIGLAINDWKKGLALKRGYLTHVPIQSVVFGVACIYLGFGSGFFHASLTRCGQQCDVGGMYATMLCVAAIPIGSWLPRMEVPGIRRTFPTGPLIAALVVCGSIYFTYYKWEYSFRDVSSYLHGTLLIFAAASFFQPGKYLQVRWLIAAIVSIALGAYIRKLDIQGSFSGPESIFQGHAIWHLVSCLYFLFLFWYFRSEERES